MMSAGAVGGGIMSAIARALGAGRRADADALVLHALAIAVSFGLVFMLAVLGGGRWLYGALGGRGASLAAALTYSNVVFSGAIVIWIFNSLANVIRGTGNMAVPAAVTSVGAAALIPLSPCLIFGWGPFPRLGVAGGAVAVVAYYAVGSVALTAYLWAGRSVVRLAFEGARFRWPLFRDILRVGAVAALITVQTNLDRKSTRLNSSHLVISYAVFCLKKKNNQPHEAGLSHQASRAITQPGSANLELLAVDARRRPLPPRIQRAVAQSRHLTRRERARC